MYHNDHNDNNRIVFLTGTRADYGKLKSLIKATEQSERFEPHIFATGMHMLSKYGSTYKEIKKDNFQHIYTYINQNNHTPMDITLSNTILGFSNYIAEVAPIGIVVHGDRLEALAGAIVGAFNNIKVFHIEGGEVSGTIDESIRHAITKFSHYHFVANEDAKRRIIQLGEPENNIFIFGSPDIDIMYSQHLPSKEKVFEHYNIPFEHYNIFMYHPVTTEPDILEENIDTIIQGLIASKENYIVIYPNNDLGSDLIIRKYKKLLNHPHFRVFPSVRFEAFLTMLKHCSCMIGNSSSGIREANIYGVPTIDIGTRQQGRYNIEESPHIIHVDENEFELIQALHQAHTLNLTPKSYFGTGNSNEIFMDILSNPDIWNAQIQKKFIDVDF